MNYLFKYKLEFKTLYSKLFDIKKYIFFLHENISYKELFDIENELNNNIQIEDFFHL